MSAVMGYIRDVFLGLANTVGTVFKSFVDWLRIAYSPCPYWRGNVLTVCADGNPPFQGRLNMIISRVFQPSVWNVMEVAVIRSSGPPVKAVLKVFDRRFSPCVRDGTLGRAFACEWSPEVEEEFVDFVRRGEAGEWSDYRQSEWFDTEERRNKLQDEVDRHLECEAARKSQLARYQDCMGQSKGTTTPRIYATVSMALGEESDGEFLVVKGILMEYVSGVNLGFEEQR